MDKKEYTCSGKLNTTTKLKKIENKDGTIEEKSERVYHITAIIGDRFLNGGFFPKEELERVYKNWEGTLHDINHWGTSYPTGFTSSSNILYFVGFHKNVEYNSTTREVTMDIQVNRETMYGKAWEKYVETCELAGIIPNVSVTYLGRQKLIKADELPEGTDYKSEGYSDSDLVPILTDVEPVCVSTVLRGRCNDKDGCGIRDSCSQDEQDIIDALEKEKQEIIKYLKEENKNE